MFSVKITNNNVNERINELKSRRDQMCHDDGNSTIPLLQFLTLQELFDLQLSEQLELKPLMGMPRQSFYVTPEMIQEGGKFHQYANYTIGRFEDVFSMMAFILA